MSTREQHASARQQEESELLLEQLHHVVHEELERLVLAGKEAKDEHARALKAEQATRKKLAGEQATLQKQLGALKAAEKEQHEESQLLLEQLHVVQEELERYGLEKKQHEQEQQLLQRRLIQLREIIERREREQRTQNANLAESQNQLLDIKEKQKTHEREHALALAAANQKLSVARLGSKHKARRRLKREMQLIGESSLFDSAWYLATYPDVAEAGIDPVEHYLKAGAGEGRNPGPEFDTAWYVTLHADVVESGLNPLVHYICFGRSEQRLLKPGSLLLAAPEHQAQSND